MEQHSARILVVDDEAMIRLTLDMLLRRRGYDVVVAADGAEALALLKQHLFNLVLLDLTMPGISGLDVARHIRATQGTTALMLLTGNTAFEDAMDATALDGFDVMFKTASPHEVLKRVEAAIMQQKRQ